MKFSKKEIKEKNTKLTLLAEKHGYHLNPDNLFTNGLVESLLTNEKRYGYPSCPCRLSSGNREKDLDIICPCYYRDQDLNEFGTCYCSLYVTKEVIEGKKKALPIPERRPPEEQRNKKENMPVWRCKVCGYLCSREEAPDECPICGARSERFEELSSL